MRILKSMLRLALGLSLAAMLVSASAQTQAPMPRNFLYTSVSDISGIQGTLARPDIEGVQVVYSWKELEPEKDHYDFSRIEHTLQITGAARKKLFVQVQDRFFEPQARNIPLYLQNDPVYGGGLVEQSDNPGMNKKGSGWVAEQWNPALRARYQKLLKELASRFDGQVYGVNLPESSIDIDMKHDHSGFSCDKYFDAELDNMKFARGVFHKSYVVQYINFWPCEWNNDHKYMSRAFEFAAQNGIGVGGPDIVPYRKGQMMNSYPLFHQYRGKLVLVAMAVQEPTLTYVNPKTGKRFSKDEFQEFARDYLGANMIFWSTSSPWLRH